MGGMAVIVPTYNESEVIIQTIETIRAELSDTDFEIVVVDDDSPDRTWELVEWEYADATEVRVIRRREKQGLGTAVLRGIDEATREYCVVADGDLQHPPQYIQEIYARLTQGADLAIGSRYVSEGDIRGWSTKRLLISLGAVAIARTLISEARSIRDPISGFFGVRADIIDTSAFCVRGYKVLLEILVRGDYERVDEVPFTFEERKAGSSSLSSGECVKFLGLITSLLRDKLKYRLDTLSELMPSFISPQQTQYESDEG